MQIEKEVPKFTSFLSARMGSPYPPGFLQLREALCLSLGHGIRMKVKCLFLDLPVHTPYTSLHFSLF